MQNKIWDGNINVKWMGVIVFIVFWAGFLVGVWAMGLPNKNSVNIGSSGNSSSIQINQSDKPR